MQLIIDQPALVRELSLVTAVAETRSQVRLEARDKGVLRLTVHNVKYGLKSDMEARVTESGVICLLATPLLSLVNELDGEITIHTDSKNYATVISGRSHSRMPGEAVDTFPELPVMPEGGVGVPAQTLVRLLSRVNFAAARGVGPSVVPAVLAQFTGDTLACVATDWRRLALAQAPMAAVSPRQFLLPSEAIGHVKKLVEDQERAYIAAGAQHLFIAAGSRLLAARQLAGSFQDYQRFLPRFDTPPVEIDSVALRSAIARVLPFIDGGARKMRFVFGFGGLSISAASVHGGEGEDVVACDYFGPEIALDFDPSYIREFLDVVPEGKLRVWARDDHTVTEWRPAGDDAYRYIAMPLPAKVSRCLAHK